MHAWNKNVYCLLTLTILTIFDPFSVNTRDDIKVSTSVKVSIMNLIMVSYLPTESSHASHPVSRCAGGQIISLSVTGAVQSALRFFHCQRGNLRGGKMSLIHKKEWEISKIVQVYVYCFYHFLEYVSPISHLEASSTSRLTGILMIVVKIASAHSELI